MDTPTADSQQAGDDSMSDRRVHGLMILTAAAAGAAMIAAAGAAGPARGPAPRGPAAAPALPPEPPITLPRSTPADGRPQINGPLVTGSNLGHLFLYRIPASGDAPLAYAADNLPAGLTLDPATGIITGSMKTPTVATATLHAKNAKGEAARPLVIVGAPHALALTPPLGWNSWNCWGLTVSDARVRAAADGFDKSGLAAHGFQYVNIDDGWEIRVQTQGRAAAVGGTTRPAVLNADALRAADGTINVNEKFPDMKALGAYIHAKGLKFGIYSSPGPRTCGQYTASWEHEEQDVATWASWGVDYIKYDWCSYSEVAPPDDSDAPRFNRFTLKQLKLPYQVLRTALDKQDRDIVMSLCQYGWGNVWEWGAQDGINGNLWRATGDITDTWGSMSGIGFAQNGHEKFAGPGHWNDTDMLVVGKVGWGNTPRANRMTQNEQLTHIALWSILAAPMLLGCDLTQLDEFTTNMMSNDEMLAVNQDPFGRQGWRIAAMDAADQPVTGTGNAVNRAPKQVWARPLADGTVAVGLFNLGNDPARVAISLKALGEGLQTTFTGPVPVRDIWQLKDLPPAADTLAAEVPRHGVAFLKLGTPKPLTDVVAAVVKLHTPQ
jgi:alpha-galactosidase